MHLPVRLHSHEELYNKLFSRITLLCWSFILSILFQSTSLIWLYKKSHFYYLSWVSFEFFDGISACVVNLFCDIHIVCASLVCADWQHIEHMTHFFSFFHLCIFELHNYILFLLTKCIDLHDGISFAVGLNLTLDVDMISNHWQLIDFKKSTLLRIYCYDDFNHVTLFTTCTNKLKKKMSPK
jgi:hypothetical protein